MYDAELKRLQSLPLEEKVTMTKLRIVEWYDYWEGKVFVSYSGGKDSTVLLHIAREVCPDIPAVYTDTGLEFPEVRQHAINTPNVTIVKPEMSFREVIKEHGFVYPSKDVARVIRYAEKGSEWAVRKMNGLRCDTGEPNGYVRDRYGKWNFLLDAPFKISDICCEIMKERPLKKFEREHGAKPIIGTMAAESLRRKRAYINTGCNAYTQRRKRSAPLSFWTEQDVLQYIVDNNIKIASAYGEIIRDKKGKLHTTGEKRTGCMFCPIGCHLEKVSRFQRMKENHPKIYDYCMNQLGMKDFLDYIGVKYT